MSWQKELQSEMVAPRFDRSNDKKSRFGLHVAQAKLYETALQAGDKKSSLPLWKSGSSSTLQQVESLYQQHDLRLLFEMGVSKSPVEGMQVLMPLLEIESSASTMLVRPMT
mmetsp:Transcript_20711/g.52440  ORF Transcript_20711/g.52440 Transcript_20711/m.52440 type:complete len:111 (+) Transcript_20711:1281-1613(+)